jgi:hypothetical protein
MQWLRANTVKRQCVGKDKCDVCQFEYAASDRVITLPCKHFFHSGLPYPSPSSHPPPSPRPSLFLSPLQEAKPSARGVGLRVAGVVLQMSVGICAQGVPCVGCLLRCWPGVGVRVRRLSRDACHVTLVWCCHPRRLCCFRSPEKEMTGACCFLILFLVLRVQAASRSGSSRTARAPCVALRSRLRPAAA